MLAQAEDVYTGAKALVDRARTDPVWFAETILCIKSSPIDKINWDLDIWQKELLEAVADVYRKQESLPTLYNHEGKNMITVRAMHGPGKTFGAAAIMHWFNFCFYGTIVCTAPKEKQLKTRLWPTFRKIRNRAGTPYSSYTKVDGTKIVWMGDEDWVAHAETASEPENLAGYHADYLLFIVDEASGVKEEMFPVIEGAVSTGILVIVLLIGNPTKNLGTFFDSHCRPIVAKNYYPIHVDINKTTRVSKEWINKQRQKYGINSPVYKVRCLGEFADEDANQLLSLSWVEDSIVPSDNKPDDGSFPRLRISVDVADGGVDSSEITVGYHYESFVLLVKQYSYNFPSSEAPILTAKAAERVFLDFNGDSQNGDDFVVDSIGVGAGTAGTLIELGYNVVTYKGGEASDDSTQWRNRRAQSYIGLRNNFRDKKIFLLDNFVDDDEDWEELYAQLCSVKTKNGQERVEELVTKDEMIRQGLKSPDRADSIAMQMATQVPHIASHFFVPEVTGRMQSA